MSKAIREIMRDIGKEAKDAAHVLPSSSTEAKDYAIKIAASALRYNLEKIIF